MQDNGSTELFCVVKSSFYSGGTTRPEKPAITIHFSSNVLLEYCHVSIEPKHDLETTFSANQISVQ